MSTVTGRPGLALFRRQLDDILDQRRIAPILAAGRNDQRGDEPVPRRRDAPSAGEAGKVRTRVRRRGRHGIGAGLRLPLEPGQAAAGEHRVDAMRRTPQNARPAHRARPRGSPRPERSRRAVPARIPPRRMRPSAPAHRRRRRRPLQARRSSLRRRRRRTEKGGARARWRRRRSRPRRRSSPPCNALPRSPGSSR